MEEFQELEEVINDHFNRRPVQRELVRPDHVIRVVDLVDDGVDEDNTTQPLHIPDLEEGTSSSSENDADTPESCPDDFYNHCTCAKQCLHQFDKGAVYNQVYNVMEMEKDTKEACIMGALDKIVTSDKRCRNGKRIRIRYHYTFKGRTICRGAFMFLFDVSERKLKALQTHSRRNGIVPRVHGNTGRRPKHALTFQDAEKLVHFILAYGNEHGIPQPAAPRGRDDTAPTYLPASTTKRHVHKIYADSCEAADVRVIGYCAFCTIWRQCCSHIKIATPETDICAKCEMLRKKVSDARTDDDKIQTALDLSTHVMAAKKEFEVYKSCIQASLAELQGIEPPMPPALPCSTDVAHAHYTFDFSQNVSLPQHVRQMGPMYFLTPKKVHLFGVRDDGLPRQYNFVIDESQTMGEDGKAIHGPDAIISMVDFALEQFNHGEKQLTLHADNASGQNKNRYVMAYLCWRTIVGLNTDIRYLMQLPGHARCIIDAGFGHIKKLYRRSDCETLTDIENVVNKSARTNVAVMYGNTWQWRHWKTFLEGNFKALKGIRDFQQFRFSREHPGNVFVKKGADSQEVRICIWSGAPVPVERPPSVPAAGLSRERRRYLASQIGPYLREANREITCPPPLEE